MKLWCSGDSDALHVCLNWSTVWAQNKVLVLSSWWIYKDTALSTLCFYRWGVQTLRSSAVFIPTERQMFEQNYGIPSLVGLLCHHFELSECLWDNCYYCVCCSVYNPFQNPYCEGRWRLFEFLGAFFVAGLLLCCLQFHRQTHCSFLHDGPTCLLHGLFSLYLLHTSQSAPNLSGLLFWTTDKVMDKEAQSASGCCDYFTRDPIGPVCLMAVLIPTISLWG